MLKSVLVLATLTLFAPLARAKPRASSFEVQWEARRIALLAEIQKAIADSRAAAIGIDLKYGCEDGTYAIPPWSPGIACASVGVPLADAWAMTAVSPGYVRRSPWISGFGTKGSNR